MHCSLFQRAHRLAEDSKRIHEDRATVHWVSWNRQMIDLYSSYCKKARLPAEEDMEKWTGHLKCVHWELLKWKGSFNKISTYITSESWREWRGHYVTHFPIIKIIIHEQGLAGYDRILSMTTRKLYVVSLNREKWFLHLR